MGDAGGDVIHGNERKRMADGRRLEGEWGGGAGGVCIDRESSVFFPLVIG